MKRLNKWQSAIFAISAVIMVVGVLAGLWKSAFFPHIYAVGAVGYVCIQLLQRYEGSNFVIIRLRRIMILSDFLLLLTAVLMFAGQGYSLGLEWLYYLQYVRINWIVVLLLAAILQLYTTYRISSELEKEAKKL